MLAAVFRVYWRIKRDLFLFMTELTSMIYPPTSTKYYQVYKTSVSGSATDCQFEHPSDLAKLEYELSLLKDIIGNSLGNNSISDEFYPKSMTPEHESRNSNDINDGESFPAVNNLPKDITFQSHEPTSLVSFLATTPGSLTKTYRTETSSKKHTPASPARRYMRNTTEPQCRSVCKSNETLSPDEVAVALLSKFS
eukprot:Tbor_TRINITY_DN5367_c3_g1::TRINITY_DN5367_c3_g1_i1::g.3804::m.3804